MEYRKFGRLDWQVSQIGMGTWALGSNWGPQNDDDSIKALHQAIDLGCNFIDTARAYGDGRSERIIAQALNSGPRAIPSMSPPRCRRSQSLTGWQHLTRPGRKSFPKSISARKSIRAYVI